MDAQQARRVLDRIVGYKISPLLWDKVRRGLSAGRVQTVALRLIVEREQEIKAFVPKEYWTIHARLEAGEAADLRSEADQATRAKSWRFRTKRRRRTIIEESETRIVALSPKSCRSEKRRHAAAAVHDFEAAASRV